MWKVQLFELNFDERETDAVKEVLESKWITMGEKAKEFENQFSNMLGDNVFSVAVSSCTAGLHISLLSLGIGQGDEVIVPSLTFVADINVVRLVGAKPVLADCESFENWNMSEKTIKSVLTNNTKAIMLVHFGGYPCEMDNIINLCKEKNLYLIEDCAHVPGAKYKGKSCGTFGDYGCFSFFTNKNLSIGEGGMITTTNEKLFQKAGYLRSHGMTHLTLERYKGRAISYDVVESGLNYRVDEIRAAIGIVQLEKLKLSNERRKKLVERYIENLKGIKTISIPFLNLPDIEPVYHIFPILLREDINRNSIIEGLKKEGIQTSIHYPSFKNFTAFKNLKLNDTPIAENISKRELTLPLYPTMSFEQVDFVCEGLIRTLKELE